MVQFALHSQPYEAAMWPWLESLVAFSVNIYLFWIVRRGATCETVSLLPKVQPSPHQLSTHSLPHPITSAGAELLTRDNP